MTVYMYHNNGVDWLLILKHRKADSFVSKNSYFVKKDTKLEYTEQEKSALAVFILIIVFSIIEMILAPAIAKSSDKRYQEPRDQPHPMYYMSYQVSRPYHVQASAAGCYTVVVIFQINLSCFIDPIRSCGRVGA